VDGEGRVYHLGLKYGELANRVIIVGDPNRAELLSTFFDNPLKLFIRKSNRGFNTYTGRYKGVPISVMSIGMGIPMTDFMVREARHVAKGPLAIIRLGTCGTPRDDISVGSIVVAHSSRGIVTNYDAFFDAEVNGSSSDYYHLTRPVKADELLLRDLKDALDKQVFGRRVVACSDATADSFYSSQGRIDKNFADHNETLIDDIVNLDPDVGSIQMETFHLYHLARLSGTISAAACAIVLAQRKKNDFLGNDEKHTLEKQAGRACFEALTGWRVDDAGLMDKDPACAWNTNH